MARSSSLPREGDLQAVCDIYRSESSLSESRLGALTAGNPSFYPRLRGGASCTVKLYARVLQWFSDHWPDHLEWPPDVPRPEPSAPAEAEAKEAA